MDSIFEKLEIYDFFGVWGAGSVTLFYSVVSMIAIMHWDVISELQSFNSDFSLLFLAVFCMASYFIRLVLHEIGKKVAEVVKILDLKEFRDIGVVSNTATSTSKITLFPLFHPLKYRRKIIVDSVPGLVNSGSIDAAILYLKYREKNKVPEKYHSLYGLSRGIWTGFILHLFILIVWTIFHRNSFSLSLVVVFIIDVFGVVLFFFRTYRFYLSWIKNVCVLYSFYKETENGAPGA